MTKKYTNYLVEFFKVIYETCKDHDGRIKEVGLSLEEVENFGKNYIRIYIQVELLDGEMVEFYPEKKYLSYHIIADRKKEYMEFHNFIQDVEGDMNHLLYLMKYFMPELKIRATNLQGRINEG